MEEDQNLSQEVVCEPTFRCFRGLRESKSRIDEFTETDFFRIIWNTRF